MIGHITIDDSDQELFSLMKEIVDNDYPEDSDSELCELLRVKKRTFRIDKDTESGKTYIDFPKKKGKLSFLVP